MKTSLVLGIRRFEHPLLIGAGIVKTFADVENAVRSAAAGFEIGTITPRALPGNEGNNFHAEMRNGVLLWTQNSLGMPNPGQTVVSVFAPEAIDLAHTHGKRIGINVAADTVDELIDIVLWADRFGFDWITINPACPNKFKDGKPLSFLYYDESDLVRFLLALSRFTLQTPLWWKFSPDNNTLGYQLMIGDYLQACRPITGVVMNNTVPHTLALLDNGDPSIKMKYAGLAGPAVRPKAMADIARFRERYGDRFTLVAAGGATYGSDIRDFLRVGADVVQATSVCYASGLDMRVYSEMLSEYSDLED